MSVLSQVGSRSSARSHHSKQGDIQQAVAIIDSKLYFFTTRYRPKSNENVHFFSIDNVLRYEPFFVDFGPLNLGCLYKFCGLLKHKLKDERYSKARIYYYCDKDPQRIANAAYLIGAFSIIELGRHPAMAFESVKPIALRSVPFRDASMGICTYKCTVEHCLWATYRALQRKYLDFSCFNVDEYQHYERVEYGDLNIIIPNKFLAFAGPHYKDFDDEGYPALTPQFYLPIWKKFGVSTIIRLNKKCYDKRVWTQAGYEHFDLYFTDGTTPNDTIIEQFIQLCENASGVVAVHCKAGLGRTGSLLGCYFMKHFCWKASECIAWLRMCRPGSVIGPQQQFLEKQQSLMWAAGDAFRKKHGLKLDHDPRIGDLAEKAEKQAADKKKQKEFAQRFVLSQQTPNQNEGGTNHNAGRAGAGAHGTAENKSDNHNYNDDSNGNKNSKLSEEKEENRLPLATDPGQNQGGALINAKRHHKHRASNDDAASHNSGQNSVSSMNGNGVNHNGNHQNGHRSSSHSDSSRGNKTGTSNNYYGSHGHSHGHAHGHSHGHTHGHSHGHSGQGHSNHGHSYGHGGHSYFEQQAQSQMREQYQFEAMSQSQLEAQATQVRSQSSTTPNRSSKALFSNSNAN